MGLTDHLSPINDTVRTAFQGVEAVLEVVQKWRAYRISDVTTLKMLYLELDRYLELAEIFDNKNFAQRHSDPATVFGLIRGIDLTVTGLVLAREEKHSVFRKLMRRGILRHQQNVHRRDYENVLQALSFIYSKTGILKQLSETGDKALFREIKFTERLQNIEDSINLVLKTLVTFPEVNAIARRWHRTE